MALPPAPGRKKFAPLDGRIRARREGGANPGPEIQKRRPGRRSSTKKAPAPLAMRAAPGLSYTAFYTGNVAVIRRDFPSGV